MTAGLPTAKALAGTVVSLSTTEFAPTIAPEQMRARCRTHLRTIFQDAGFEMSKVTHEAIVTHGGRPFERGVHDGAILNAGACTNAYLAIIAAQHRSGPHTGLWTNNHRTDNDRIWMDEGGGINRGDLGAKCVDGHEIVLLAWVAHDTADGY
jgi:hypothetical protein